MSDELAKMLGTGVVAALLTVGFAWLKEWWFTAKRAKPYASMQVAVTLESFALRCDEILTDYDLSTSHWGDRKVDGSIATPSMPPFPTFPSDIDWKSLPSDEMAKALTLKVEADFLVTTSVFLWRVGLDEEATLRAIELIAETGLSALDIAQRLRRGLTPLMAETWKRGSLEKYRDRARREREEHNKSRSWDIAKTKGGGDDAI